MFFYEYFNWSLSFDNSHFGSSSSTSSFIPDYLPSPPPSPPSVSSLHPESVYPPEFKLSSCLCLFHSSSSYFYSPKCYSRHSDFSIFVMWPNHYNNFLLIVFFSDSVLNLYIKYLIKVFIPILSCKIFIPLNKFHICHLPSA